MDYVYHTVLNAYVSCHVLCIFCLGQCDKNFCDACDHALHEDDDHRLHIRTPLYGHGIRDITDEKRVTTKLTTRPSSGKAEGPRVIEYVGG